MRIVFMGTPDFAVYSLTALHQSNHSISAVVTMPDKKQGRGKKIAASPVKEKALALNYPILQPESFNDPEFIAEMNALNPEIIVVVAFKKLPEELFTIPIFGTVNVHASLLPAYRGAAPINHAILNGETETGVSTFYINEEIDAGTILLQESCEILADDDFGSLYNKLALIGSDLIVKTLDQLDNEGIAFKVQDLTKISRASKITQEMCQINWKQDGQSIINHIRAFSPKPGSYSLLNEKKLKIYKADFESSESINIDEIGTIIEVEKKSFKIAVSNGYIMPKELQLQGKNKMDVLSFLNGNTLEIGTKLI